MESEERTNRRPIYRKSGRFRDRELQQRLPNGGVSRLFRSLSVRSQGITGIRRRNLTISKVSGRLQWRG